MGLFLLRAPPNPFPLFFCVPHSAQQVTHSSSSAGAAEPRLRDLGPLLGVVAAQRSLRDPHHSWGPGTSCASESPQAHSHSCRPPSPSQSPCLSFSSSLHVFFSLTFGTTSCQDSCLRCLHRVYAHFCECLKEMGDMWKASLISHVTKTSS